MSVVFFSYVLPLVHVFACLFLIVVVLLQTGKGADMGAVLGGGSQTLFGASGAGNLLTKLTTGVAITFMATSLLIVIGQQRKPSSSLLDRLPQTPPPAAVPEMPPPLTPEAAAPQAVPPAAPTAAANAPATPTAPAVPGTPTAEEQNDNLKFSTRMVPAPKATPPADAKPAGTPAPATPPPPPAAPAAPAPAAP